MRELSKKEGQVLKELFRDRDKEKEIDRERERERERERDKEKGSKCLLSIR